VKLHELQVPQHGPGPIRQGDAISGGAFRICRFPVEPAGPSGGKDRVGRLDDLRAAFSVTADDSQAFVLVIGQ
jgi:hypothetical protein